MEFATEDVWYSSQPWIDRCGGDVDQQLGDMNVSISSEMREKLKDWSTDGIVIFENVVQPELISALAGDIDYLKAHHKDFELEVELRGSIQQISQYRADELEMDGVKFNSIHTISKAAALLSLNSKVTEFLRLVFGTPPAVLQSLTFAKGSQQPIHIDYPYVRTQTRLAHLAASWIALEDIDPDSGPLAYYPGSHRPEVSGFFDWGAGNILHTGDSCRTPVEFAEYLSMMVKRQNLTPKIYCPKKGDVLIWHGNLAHEGTPIANHNLTRKSYVTHYTSLEAYPRDFSVGGISEKIYLGKEVAKAEDDRYFFDNEGFVFRYPWLKNSRMLPSAK